MESDIIKSRATEAQLKGLKATGKERLISDEATPNLFMVISAGGKKSWRWTTVGARKARLGAWPTFSLADARTWAAECNDLWKRKIDPRTHFEDREKEAQAAALRAKRDTVSGVFDEWLTEKRRQGGAEKSLHEYERLMRVNFLENYGAQPISEITKHDIRVAVAVMADRGSRVAGNRFLRVIQPFFKWAASEDYIEHDPAALVRLVKVKPAPDRALSVSELATLYRAADALPDDERDALRLLILTGTRKMEALGAASEDFRDGVWTIPVADYTDERGHTFPVSHAKSDREHHMMLPPMASAIFETRKDRKFLFHAAPHKFMMPTLADDAHAAMMKLTGGDEKRDWSLHKIRKGVRSAFADPIREMLVREGNGETVTADVAELVLGHSLGALNDRYDRGSYAKTVGRALAAWERLLKSEIDRQSGGNVVKLKA